MHKPEGEGQGPAAGGQDVQDIVERGDQVGERDAGFAEPFRDGDDVQHREGQRGAVCQGEGAEDFDGLDEHRAKAGDRQQPGAGAEILRAADEHGRDQEHGHEQHVVDAGQQMVHAGEEEAADGVGVAGRRVEDGVRLLRRQGESVRHAADGEGQKAAMQGSRSNISP